ncbi:MAG: HAMP domain-containing histidine kinase [Leptolyngbya sp. SIO1D8]|nr:HAMP domain-containing histidine kinase [Leptolyngbya sp. SIO1D8]
MTIRRRIVYGYAVVLGSALTGVTLGFIVGNHYQQRALAMRNATNFERKLLDDLQLGILYNRPAHQLAPYLNHPIRFQQEGKNLLHRVTALQELLQNYATYHSTCQVNSALKDIRNYELHTLLKSFEIVLEQFHHRTETFIAQISRLSSTPEDVKVAEQALLAFVQSSEFSAFIQFSDQLQPLSAQIEVKAQKAELALQQAETVKTYIILGSLLASVAIAAAIALYTSQAIAQPMMAVATIARRVTEEENFELQAPVNSSDEVGILAKSLNQLIQQVKQLLTQLKQKNTDLQTTFEQLKQQQEQLVHSEKMSSLGQLVAGVAHEINNPIHFIHGNLVPIENHVDDVITIIKHFQERYPDATADMEASNQDLDLDFIQEDLAKILDSMRIGTSRIRQIVLSLRNFSRLDEADYKIVNLHEGIESSLMILQHRLKSQGNRPTITIHRAYGELPAVGCYPGQFNQVVMNILANAIDAIEERYFQTPDTQKIPCEITIQTSIQGADWVEVEISDTGIGMSETIREKIFTSFFTTKPEGIGTGLGMSISYKIITETHGGKLDCVSTPGKGTRFFIRIPTHQRVAS